MKNILLSMAAFCLTLFAIAALSPAVVAADTTPPDRFGSNITIDTQDSIQIILMQIYTNEPATCRYSTTAGDSYDTMQPSTNGESSTVSDTTIKHSWIFSNMANGHKTYYIKCVDTAGNRNTDDYLISFDLVPSYSFILLIPGWNQISSPLEAGIDLSAIEAAGCKIGAYKTHKLWAWNAKTGMWIFPTRVEPFKGYWIYANEACIIPLSGTQATFSSLQLYKGWNKISALGTFSTIQGTCAGHITGNWVWNWDKATEKWSHPETMQLDKGYWISVNQDCVLGSGA